MNDQDNKIESILKFLEFSANCINEKSPIAFIIISHLKLEQILRKRLKKRLKITT